MYDKDGQHPLPQWALGPGATVWRTKFLGHKYLLKKKKKNRKKSSKICFCIFSEFVSLLSFKIK